MKHDRKGDWREEREARGNGTTTSPGYQRAEVGNENGRVNGPMGAGSERDEKGRFTEWNKGGPGNPFARQTAGLRKALCNAVTEEDIAEIARGLIQRAKEGDLAAAKMLLSYTIGKPEAATNPDTLDRKEGENFRAGAGPPLDVRDMYQSFTPAFACALMRDVLPEVMKSMARQMRGEGREARDETEMRGEGGETRGEREEMRGEGREVRGEGPGARGESNEVSGEGVEEEAVAARAQERGCVSSNGDLGVS